MTSIEAGAEYFIRVYAENDIGVGEEAAETTDGIKVPKPEPKSEPKQEVVEEVNQPMPTCLSFWLLDYLSYVAQSR